MSHDKDIAFTDLVPALWGDEPGPDRWLRLGFLHAQTKRMTLEVYKYPEALHEAQRDAQRAAGTHDDYWSPVPLKEPKRYLDKGENLFDYVADMVSVIHADLDECDPASMLVPPTVVVRTSKGRYQAYWKLAEPVSKVDAQDICKRIAYFHGIDKAHDIAHLMRYVGGINHKAGRSAATVTVVLLDATAVYQVSDFDKYPAVKPPQPASDHVGDLTMSTVDLMTVSDTLKDLFNKPIEPTKGETRLYAIVTQAWDDGHLVDEIRSIADQWAHLHGPRFIGRTDGQVARILEKKIKEDQEKLIVADAVRRKQFSVTTSTVDRPKFGKLGRILDRDELARLPKPEPLIDDWLDLRTSVLVIGETGTNKTFALLGWACSIATQTAWLGHKVRIDPCPVVYVVGEGASGLDSRISAWEAANGVVVPPNSLITVIQPASIDDPEFWSEITQFCKSIGARFVVLDTFSSLAPEADETKDAAKIIRRLGDMCTEIDGTVALAHHTGWTNKDRARGGSQLEANPDAVIVLKKFDDEDDSPVSIKRKKVKDGPNGALIWVQRTTSAESCVLEEIDAPDGASKREPTQKQSMRDKIIEFLTENPFQYGKTEARNKIGGNREQSGITWASMQNLGEIVSRKGANGTTDVWGLGQRSEGL